MKLLTKLLNLKINNTFKAIINNIKYNVVLYMQKIIEFKVKGLN